MPISTKTVMIQLSSDHLNTCNMCADDGALFQFNDKIDKSKSSVLLKFVSSSDGNLKTVDIYLR